MKKFLSVLLCGTMISCFLLTGCKSKPEVIAPDTVISDETNDYTNNNIDNTDTSVVFDEDEEFVPEPEELKDPELVWCQLYNPNGFNTVTGFLRNPNSVDIDVTYDMVFYKDGKEVYRGEDWACVQVSPNHDDIIWDNWDLPNPEDVDDIKMEVKYVTEAYYHSMDAKIEEDHVDDGNAYYKVTFDEKPTLANIWFVLYLDKNKNGKCDLGEIDSTSYASTTEKEDIVYYETNVYGDNYDSVEIYYNAY